MLDMGFINDVKRILAKMPSKRQTLFFSATMPPEIANMVKTLLVDPVKVEITPVSSTADDDDPNGRPQPAQKGVWAAESCPQCGQVGTVGSFPRSETARQRALGA